MVSPSHLKQRAMSLTRCRLFRYSLTLLEHLDRPDPNSLRVLTYHRIIPGEMGSQVAPRLQSATPDLFEQQMDFVARRYRAVSMADVLDAWEGQQRLPSRAVLITFDDAYRDFADYAWPILRRFDLPATLFVPTAFPDQPGRMFWWDRLHHALLSTRHAGIHVADLGYLGVVTADERLTTFNRLTAWVKSREHSAAMLLIDRVCRDLEVEAPDNYNVLGWDALRQLYHEGLSLGAHTRTHPLLDRVSPATVAEEVRGSMADLHKHIGADARVLAYPAGAYDRTTVRVLRESGVAAAFTTEYGMNRVGMTDPLRIRRIHVGLATSLDVLRAKLLSWSPLLCGART